MTSILTKYQYPEFQILFRAATGGKAAKSWSLAGFWEIENGCGSGGPPHATMVSLPAKNLPWLPCCYRYFIFQKKNTEILIQYLSDWVLITVLQHLKKKSYCILYFCTGQDSGCIELVFGFFRSSLFLIANVYIFRQVQNAQMGAAPTGGRANASSTSFTHTSWCFYLVDHYFVKYSRIVFFLI